MKHWSLNHDSCVECGTTDTPHKGHGLCRTCYHRQYGRTRHQTERTKLLMWVCDFLNEQFAGYDDIFFRCTGGALVVHLGDEQRKGVPN